MLAGFRVTDAVSAGDRRGGDSGQVMVQWEGPLDRERGGVEGCVDGMGGPLEAVPLGDGDELAREEEERRSGRGCMMDLGKRICDRRLDLRIHSD